jgi:hypothetical protein
MRWTAGAEVRLWAQIRFRIWRKKLSGEKITVTDTANEMLADGHTWVMIDRPWIRDPGTNEIKPHPTKQPIRKVLPVRSGHRRLRLSS